MIKEQYDEIRNEFPILPDFAELDREFELSSIEVNTHVLKNVKRKVAEKLEIVLETLEHIVSPNPDSFTDMVECRNFTAGEKKQLLEVFGRLMQQYRSVLETDLLCDDKTDAETIKRMFSVWKEEKKNVIPLFKKLKDAWSKKLEPKEILDYMG